MTEVLPLFVSRLRESAEPFSKVVFPKSDWMTTFPVARTSVKVMAPLLDVTLISLPLIFSSVMSPKSASIFTLFSSALTELTSILPLLLSITSAPSRFSTVTSPKSPLMSAFPFTSRTSTMPKLLSTSTVVSVGTVTMKSTVLMSLLKFIDLGSSYLRVMVLPFCSMLYLMVFTSSSARAWVESYAVITTLTSTVSTSPPVTTTSPAASSTIKVTGSFASTSRVLLSSTTEETLFWSNGLLPENPPRTAKNATAPMPASTNSRATTNNPITTGLFILLLLVLLFY